MAQNLDRIKAFAFDVDGVMTTGAITVDTGGEFLRTYDAKDNFGIRMARMNGYPVALITGGSSESIRLRFRASGVRDEDMFLHSRDKLADFRLFCNRNGLAPDEVMYFGDDLPDIPVMQACGCAVAPSDAVAEVLEAADIVSSRPGGRGCIREMLELVCKRQGRWNFDVDFYKKSF